MPKKEEDISAHVTARGMLSISIKDLTSTMAGVVFFVLVARYLPDVDDLGFLTGLQTLILMFMTLSALGLPNSATRFISTYIGSGRTDRANSLYPLIFVLCILASAGFSFLLYNVSPILSVSLFHGPEYTYLIQAASVDVFLSSMIFTCIFLLYASRQFAKVAAFSIVNSIIKFSLAFILFVNGWGLYGIVIGLIVGDAIALSLFVIALIPKILVRDRLPLLSTLTELKPLFKFSFPLYGAMILNFVSSRIDIYFLMILSTLYAVGIYSPALFVANTFLLILIAIDQGLLPVTARFFGKNGLVNFKYISRSASRYLFLFYFPLGITIAASAPSLIAIVMGERFIDSTYPVMIIVIAITLTSPVIIFNNLLRSAGFSGILLKNEAISISVQILLLIFMIPALGIIGAATSKFVSRFVYLIYPFIKLNRLGALDYDRRALKKGLTGSCIIGILIIIIDLLITSSPFDLLFSYVISFTVYLFFLRVTHALNKDDVEFLDKILMGKMRWLMTVLSKIVIS
jgi:O-antigen/teichoic acid export membrane protein